MPEFTDEELKPTHFILFKIEHDKGTPKQAPDMGCLLLNPERARWLLDLFDAVGEMHRHGVFELKITWLDDNFCFSRGAQQEMSWLLKDRTWRFLAADEVIPFQDGEYDLETILEMVGEQIPGPGYLGSDTHDATVIDFSLDGIMHFVTWYKAREIDSDWISIDEITALLEPIAAPKEE